MIRGIYLLLSRTFSGNLDDLHPSGWIALGLVALILTWRLSHG